jgi:maleamate amidohydrolase
MCKGFLDATSPLGFSCVDLIERNKELISIFREKKLPIFFTTTIYRNEHEATVFREKLPDLNILTPESDWVDFLPDLSPLESEEVIEKKHASGFFNTNLADKLRLLDIDTVYISGVTTSGCVRATALDSLQNNYYTFVISDCIGDRNDDAHESNLSDLKLKYTELISLHEVKEKLI